VSLLISIEIFDSIQVTITIYFLEWNASQVALVIWCKWHFTTCKHGNGL